MPNKPVLLVKGGVEPRSLYIAAAAANVASELGLTATITSGRDGVHKVNSLHYEDAALDLRSRDMTFGQRQAFITRLRQRLGRAYQVIDEHQTKVHIHVEYDPQ